MKKWILAVGLMAMMVAPLPMTHTASAEVDIYGACPKDSTDEVCKNRKNTDGVQKIFKNVVNFLMMILGAISVIMIVVGGFMYATSNGDSNKLTSAKNTIIYAAVGVVVAVLAYAIVNFAFTEVTK